MGVVIAIDAGTTGVRSRAIFSDDRPPISAYREFTQFFPQPGWVEHDATEIWSVVSDTLRNVIAQIREPIVAIGITNQRETILAWNRLTGVPYHRAIVWQDRRTAQRCDELSDLLPMVRQQTGLVLDPYFSGTKAEWLLTTGKVPIGPELALGTIDSWIIWNLTAGASFVTDASNASRTMLFDITTMQWSAELGDVFKVPPEALPTVVPSSGRCGMTATLPGIPSGIPISGIAGDQQAALFGQACFNLGSAKNSYGTGSFVLMNVGTTIPPVREGMLTTVAWVLGDSQPVYALEGAIFVTGAAIQWLRDGLNIIDQASDIGLWRRSDSGSRRGSRIHRTGESLVGSVCTWHHPWHHAGNHSGAYCPRHHRVHCLPNPRCRGRHVPSVRHHGSRSAGGWRCGSDGLVVAISSRSTRRQCAPTARSRIHRH